MERGKRLAGVAARLFAIDHTLDPEIEFDKTDVVGLDDPEALTSRKMLSFTLQGVQYPHRVYATMPVRVLELLEKERPGFIRRLAASTAAQSPDHATLGACARRIYISTSPDKMHWPHKLAEGVYIDLHGSGKKQMRKVAACLQAAGLPPDSFYLTLNAEGDRPSGEETSE